MSLEQSDREAAAHAVAPRVALSDIEGAIVARFDFRGLQVHDELGVTGGGNHVASVIEALAVLSVCIVVVRNGFTIIGKSAPASPQNFNAELGKKLAYEDCIRQLWPLMGFALRDRLAAASAAQHHAAIAPHDPRNPAGTHC